MANAVYPIYKTALGAASADVSLTVNTVQDGPYVSLIDTGTVAYSAAHDFYDDVVAAIGGTTQRLTTPTFGSVSQGTFDADNVTYTAVAGTVSYEALIVYRHNAGANTTWRLVLYLDTSVTNLPVTSNGGDITVTWSASGIFTL